MVIQLEDYKIKNLPDTAYYIPDFISNSDHDHLMQCIYKVPKPKWTCLSNRRLQDYGGVPHKNGMIVETIPEWLTKYINKIVDVGIYPGDKSPNHVLINEYEPGQGIMAHTDGPLFYPIITTINLSSHSVLELRKNDLNSVVTEYKILLEPKSLLILKDVLYTDYLHSISEVKSDELTEEYVNLNLERYKIGDVLERDLRLSVTIRNVPKVAKLNINHVFKKF